MLDHERMPVYQAALRFNAQADQIATAMPPGRAYLALQLQRAAASIAQNIGEGAGEYSAPEKARFYRIALRSATECAATLDVALVVGAAEAGPVLPAKEGLRQIVCMLVALCKRLGDSGGRGKGHGKGEGPRP